MLVILLRFAHFAVCLGVDADAGPLAGAGAAPTTTKRRCAVAADTPLLASADVSPAVLFCSRRLRVCSGVQYGCNVAGRPRTCGGGLRVILVPFPVRRPVFFFFAEGVGVARSQPRIPCQRMWSVHGADNGLRVCPPHPADNWAEKSIRRKTTGTGRCRYIRSLPRRAKNGFRGE